MITVDNLINSVLVGDYSELEANILITKYFNNKHFVDFYETFKSKVTYILNDFVLKLSSDEILQIIQEITEFNNIIESRSKIIIPKVYIYSFDEWNTIKHFYKKVGEYECVFNLCGFDTKPVNKEVFKELIYLNDLIKKYISNEWYGFLPICYNEILAPLKNYPVLLNILQNLNKKTCSSIENEIISLSNFNVNNSSLKALQHQQTEKPKPELKLNEFFIKEVSSDTIEAIQTEFRELEGKDLAILIYLLHKEHKIIEILTNSKTKGRKSFVKSLKENDKPSMQKVNKCFVANTDDLIYSKDDLIFQSLNKRLSKIIE